jgi:hypothetical protein
MEDMMTAPTGPATIRLASSKEGEVVKLGSVTGLGVAAADGYAAMITVASPAEAHRIAAELLKAAGDPLA